MIPTVSVTRYVTPLREGGSLPGIVEADDLGTYVCKFRGAGQGVRVLVAEVVVGELARRIGLATPRLVALDLDPAIARYEADEEVQDLLNASPGHNLGVDFLPGSFGFDGTEPSTARSGPGVGAKVLWLDAFCANVDRTWRNPNLLFWHGELWVIDHGASLYFHHGWGSGALMKDGAPDRFAGQPWDPADHVFREHVAALPRVDAELADLLGPEVFSDVLGEVPDAWLEAVPGADSPGGRARGLRRLPDRAARDPVVVADRGRRVSGPSRMAYQYVVLRCVPRVDREEFLNVGVVVYCQEAEFLEAVWNVEADRLRALDPRIDVDQLCDALAFVDGVCAGDDRGGAAAEKPIGTRFGFVKAPRSTVLQPGPVHGGVTADPARQLEHLLSSFVG